MTLKLATHKGTENAAKQVLAAAHTLLRNLRAARDLMPADERLGDWSDGPSAGEPGYSDWHASIEVYGAKLDDAIGWLNRSVSQASSAGSEVDWRIANNCIELVEPDIYDDLVIRDRVL